MILMPWGLDNSKCLYLVKTQLSTFMFLSISQYLIVICLYAVLCFSPLLPCYLPLPVCSGWDWQNLECGVLIKWLNRLQWYLDICHWPSRPSDSKVHVNDLLLCLCCWSIEWLPQVIFKGFMYWNIASVSYKLTVKLSLNVKAYTSCSAY